MKTKIVVALSLLLLLALFEKTSRLEKAIGLQSLRTEVKKETPAKLQPSKERTENKTERVLGKKTFESTPRYIPQQKKESNGAKDITPAPSQKPDIRFNLPENKSSLPGLADSVCKKLRYTEKVKTIVIV